jgi:hypothetical protein
MRIERSSSKYRVALQVIVVAITSAGLTFAADRLDVRTPANLIWICILPVLVGFAVNVGWYRRSLVAFLLLAVSLAAVVAVGDQLGSY